MLFHGAGFRGKPKETSPYIIVKYNSEINGLTLVNNYNTDFPGRTVFISSSEPISDYRNNKFEFFELLSRDSDFDLSIGYEPCGAIMVEVTIDAKGEKSISFYMGQSNSNEDIKSLLDKYKDITAAEEELEMVRKQWRDITGKIKVKTPDKSMDIMLNGWLVYQTISCRLWEGQAFISQRSLRLQGSAPRCC